jgi:hypothetical protein
MSIWFLPDTPESVPSPKAAECSNKQGEWDLLSGLPLLWFWCRVLQRATRETRVSRMHQSTRRICCESTCGCSMDVPRLVHCGQQYASTLLRCANASAAATGGPLTGRAFLPTGRIFSGWHKGNGSLSSRGPPRKLARAPRGYPRSRWKRGAS